MLDINKITPVAGTVRMAVLIITMLDINNVILITPLVLIETRLDINSQVMY